jgi:flavin-dependent dehydrogenase
MEMRVAVVGCGWSGSLLAYWIPKLGHEVDVYELRSHPRVVCGCGVPTDLFKEVAEACDLDPESYILWRGRHIIMKFISAKIKQKIRNLCTFKKQKFIQDVVNKSNAHFYFGTKLLPQHFSEYDLVIDASGVRAVLGALPTDNFNICYQVRASFSPSLPYPDFLMDFSGQTEHYLWMFPLSQNEAYVGCGSQKGRNSRSRVLEFVDRFHGAILEEQCKRIRLKPPQESLPFIHGNIVGVGNSIGAITSLAEGIAPSMMTAKMLLDNLTDLQQYEKEVLKEIGWLEHDYAAYNAWVRNEKLKLLYHFIKVQKYYKGRFKGQFNETLQVITVLLRTTASSSSGRIE